MAKPSRIAGNWLSRSVAQTVSAAHIFTGNPRFTGGLRADAISEDTAAAGVTIDGVILKDGGATLSGAVVVGGALDHDGGTVGFYGATPVARPLATADLRQALIDLGLYTTGGASPLNLNGGDLTAAGIAGTSLMLSDTVLSRGAANRLDLASGDSFRIATDGSVSAGRFEMGTAGDAHFWRATTSTFGTDSTWAYLGTGGTDVSHRIGLASEAIARLVINASGLHEWSDGTNGADVVLERTEAGVVGLTTGQFRVTAALGSTVALSTRVSGEPGNRLEVNADGVMKWGDGGGGVYATLAGDSGGSALSLAGGFILSGALDHDGSTVGFFGATPVAQRSGWTQTYATATRSHALSAADEAHALNAVFNDTEVEAALNALAQRINEVKQLVNSLIDDEQALGLSA